MSSPSIRDISHWIPRFSFTSPSLPGGDLKRVRSTFHPPAAFAKGNTHTHHHEMHWRCCADTIIRNTGHSVKQHALRSKKCGTRSSLPPRTNALLALHDIKFSPTLPTCLITSFYPPPPPLPLLLTHMLPSPGVSLPTLLAHPHPSPPVTAIPPVASTPAEQRQQQQSRPPLLISPAHPAASLRLRPVSPEITLRSAPSPSPLPPPPRLPLLPPCCTRGKRLGRAGSAASSTPSVRQPPHLIRSRKGTRRACLGLVDGPPPTVLPSLCTVHSSAAAAAAASQRYIPAPLN